MSTTTASTMLLRMPTVTSLAAPAASPSFAGSCEASLESRAVMSYLSLSSRNCSLLVAQVSKSLT